MTTITPERAVVLWAEHWRDIKLRALSLKFYDYQPWMVQAGDLYCLTRHGAALFRVLEMGDKITLLEMINDEGEPSEQLHEWDAHEFRHGGFAENRVPIPSFIWRLHEDYQS